MQAFARLQEVSIFLFDKRSVDKLHKPKRRGTITDILRAGATQMELYKHPKLLQVHTQDICGTRIHSSCFDRYAYIAVRASSRATRSITRYI